MKISTTAALIALGMAGTATAAIPILYEKQMARAEESRIIAAPIAGIANSRWYDYRNDIGEAKKELSSDLHRASDLEDTRDAWEEYADELKNERVEYVKYMAKRGHRYGSVIWDD